MTVNLDGKAAGLWVRANVARPSGLPEHPRPFKKAGPREWAFCGRLTVQSVSSFGEIDLWVKVRVRVSQEPPGNTKGKAGAADDPVQKPGRVWGDPTHYYRDFKPVAPR
jgi:hypothetical protein